MEHPVYCCKLKQDLLTEDDERRAGDACLCDDPAAAEEDDDSEDVDEAAGRQLNKYRSSRKIDSQTIFKRIGLPEDLFSE